MRRLCSFFAIFAMCFSARYAMATDQEAYTLSELGYKSLALKQYDDAVRYFDSSLPHFDKVPSTLFGDIAYANMHLSRNKAAISRFREAIDANDDEPHNEKTFLQNWNYRSEIRKLNRQFSTTLVWGWHSGGDTGIRQNPIIDNTASGLEFAWTPPVIGLRDERLFQVIFRALWGNTADEFDLNFDTTQGAVGLRYKPFRTQNINFGIERLFKIGSQAEDIWLARVMGSWGARGIIPTLSNWFYWHVYLEYDRFFNGFDFSGEDSRSVFYGEARFGWTWNVKNRYLFSPHVLASYRHWDTSFTSSVDAVGLGVMIKFLANETKYEAALHEYELLVQYKTGTYRQFMDEESKATVDMFLISLYYRF